MKKARWHIRDLIDLEYFQKQDETDEEESGYHAVAKRDREIYLQHVLPLEQKTQNLTDAHVIRYWLERRRDMEKSGQGPETLLPGESFDDIHRLLAYCLTAAGLLGGSGLAFSLLSYKGSAPVNISIYLGTFVFLQLLLLLLLLLIAFIRKLRRFPLRSSVIYILMTRLITLLMEKVKKQALKRAGGSQVDAFEAVKGILKGKRQIYGSLFYWPVFILAQVFGVAFNLGVLGATLLKVLGSDIAFGWQSTVQFSSEAVFDIIRIIALPWSWFVPAGVSHPSLSQVQGSHMILKEGVYHLATTDLVSWWPFLCLSVLFYGLLPRTILLMTGFLVQKRRLGSIAFNHAACERLLHRMKTPLVVTEGNRVESGHPRKDDTEKTTGQIPSMSPATKGAPAENDLIVLVPDDIFDDCPEDELGKVLSLSLGYALRKRIPFGDDDKGERKIIDDILLANRDEGPASLMILREAWQPPIREDMQFLKDLRKGLGKGIMIKIGLIGRPQTDNIFTPVKKEDWEAWKRKIKALGDPYLGLERLVENDA